MLWIPSCLSHLTVDVVPSVIHAAFFHLQPCICAFKPVYKTKLEDAMSIRVKFGSNILEPLANFSHASCCSRLVRQMSTSSGHIRVTGRTVKQSAAANCRHRRQRERTMLKKQRSQAAARPVMPPPKQSPGLKSTPKAFDRILTCHCKGISFMVGNLRSTYHLNNLYIVPIV